MSSTRRAQQNLVRVDDKRRIVLPRNLKLAEHYAVEATEEGEIILHPRVLVDPRETISTKTMEVLDASMEHLLSGRAGKAVDLSSFDLSEEDGQTEKQQAKRRHD